MSTKLLNSFGAVYRLLERPRPARRALAGVLFIHTLLLAYSAYVHSPTLNEPAHLVAGLSEWKFGRFDVYNVNPPLVKMVAALPVIAAGYNEDWSGFHESPGARPEIGMGEAFVKANGERSFFLFMIARWACIPFSWLGAIICYLWARDLYGRPTGVMASAIWCFEPNILAHASLMTPDAHATALGLAACYTFWRWLKWPTWGQAALTGLVLGFAELAKTTLILFYPLWPLMWIVYRWPDRASLHPRDWVRESGMLALRMAIGLYVLNLGYGFEGSFTSLKDYHFVSDLFTVNGSNLPPSDTRYPTPDTSSSNRFADTWLGGLPVPFPKNYVLGIDIQQRDFEHYDRPSYLRGKWRDDGWWYYYLYACAIKVPLGLWGLGFYVLIVRIYGSLRARSVGRAPTSDDSLVPAPRDEFIVILPAVTIFAVVSAKTGFSEHMRYVLPSLPFFFIWISGNCLTLIHRWVYCGSVEPTFGRRLPFAPWSSTSVVPIFSCWIVATSLCCYPHSLSYFNELIGGPLNGPSQLLGSNVDWGQDLRYVQWWIARHAGDLKDSRVYFGYFGCFDPTNVGFSFTSGLNHSPVPTSKGSSVENVEDRRNLAVISTNLLYGIHLYARGGGETARVDQKILEGYLSEPPADHIGYSVTVYDSE